MRSARTDGSLRDTLAWAVERMKAKGFDIRSNVQLSVDPKLSIMGYAKKEKNAHTIVISDWALDSEMLGGLLIHELAHIYFTERGAHSHDGQVVEEILGETKENDGLRAKETEYLIDAFNHLQNILVDDVVFSVMDEKEHEMARRFFTEWVTEKPSGDPVLDSALLCRNAFAIASLDRRGLSDPEDDMVRMNRRFVSALGEKADVEFRWLEWFLKNAKSDWTEAEFRDALKAYFERLLSSMRASSALKDLR